ncbi:hypothetical protein EST38_g9739 [Candolleomyces aberdarensis]|uniref:F-box domain-containing protein n=1 Tax=Candolleomyces aberdarensis TaxID=2316362 RepID=A0A4Q2D958_9AGAR|nr:hypothetical protein EST38_g9739 [Candolleomyces aberdarensis]
MTTQADFPTSIPDIAGDFRDERASNTGFMPGPPLREGSVPSNQSDRGNTFPNRASSAANTLKENRKIVTIILRYLNNRKDLLTVLRVCRTWSEWAAELLWYKVDFYMHSHHWQLLRTLESPNPTFPYSKFIRRANLFSLEPFFVDSMLPTLSQCEFLERLTLNGCTCLASVVLEDILNSWPNLVSIDLTNVRNVTNVAIISLTKTSSNLLGINLNGCKRLGDPAFISLAENCSGLRRVKLGRSDLVTDIGVFAVVKGCPLLVELDVHGCSNITDIAIRAVWTHSRNMRELRLAGCDTLTDLAFPSKVEVNEPDDTPQLEDQKNHGADFSGQGERSGLSVAATEDHAVSTDPPQSVSEGKELANTDPQLSVSSLPGLTSVELCPFVIHQGLTNLRYLDLSSCTLITDIAIEGVIACAPGLRTLVLKGCTLLTDRSVEAICKLGRSLHYLTLAHVEQITDESIKDLTRSCNMLRYVDFEC